ncbi:MAG: hypothetical protein NTV86_06525 [Planctomycetota bacterium]|nr:hypothetical protein [Planctomycetota bacterium]
MSKTNGRVRLGGFILTDLVVLVVLLTAVAAIPVAAGMGLAASARARACTANLKAHANAFFSYRNDNQNKLPALYVGADPGAAVNAGTCWGDPDSGFNDKADRAAALKAMGSNAMQNVWLIIDGGYIGGGERAYKCPGDVKYSPRPEDSKKYGWVSPNNFSYSIQFPYGGTSQEALAGSDPVSYVLPGESAKPPKPDATWNWANPNGLVAAPGEHHGKAMYPETCIYMADRNPRAQWAGAFPGQSNHDGAICYLEKGATNGMVTAADGKIGFGRDDIYTNRKGTGGLPWVDPATGFDPGGSGFAKAPCTDTVLWPLDARVEEKPATAPAAK